MLRSGVAGAIDAMTMRTSLSRALGIGLAIWLWTWTGVGIAHSDEPLAQPDGVTGVTSYGGVVAWSSLDDQGNYRLMAREQGQTRVLPVEPRSVPFDVDLGPGPRGDVVAVYSRCRREPRVPSPVDESLSGVAPLPAYTTGKGCDLFMLDLAEASESRLEGPSTDESSESRPSIWAGNVAFARVYESRSGRRGQLPYMYVKPFVEGDRSERRPGSSRGDSGLPGPVDIELGEELFAFTWSYTVGDESDRQRTEMRIVADDGERRVLGRARGEEGTLARYHSPDISDERVLYGFQRLRVTEEAVAVPDENGMHTDAVRFVASTVTSLMFGYRVDTEDTGVRRFAHEDPLVATSVDDNSIVLALREGDAYFDPTAPTQIVTPPQ